MATTQVNTRYIEDRKREILYRNYIIEHVMRKSTLRTFFYRSRWWM